MEFVRHHSNPELQNLAKLYPEDEADKYRAFIQGDDGETWYELDFKRVLKDTTKIHYRNLNNISVRERDSIFTSVDYHKSNNVNKSIYEVVDAVYKTSHIILTRYDLNYILSAIVYIMDNYENIRDMKKDKYDVEIFTEIRNNYIDLQIKLYDEVDKLLEGPFTMYDLMSRLKKCRMRYDDVDKRVYDRSNLLNMIKLNHFLRENLVAPIPEEEYQHQIHKWHHCGFIQDFEDDIENSFLFRHKKTYIEEWKDLSGKFKKWASIFDTLCDNFQDVE